MCLDSKRGKPPDERRGRGNHRAAISLLEDPAKRLIRVRGFSVKFFFVYRELARAPGFAHHDVFAGTGPCSRTRTHRHRVSRHPILVWRLAMTLAGACAE